MIFHSILLRMRNVSEKKVVGKIETHSLCSITFFIFEYSAVCQITLENTVEPGRPQTTIQPMHNECWISKATKTLSEYVIFIAFPLQQWLHKRTSMLHYTYITRLVLPSIVTTHTYLTTSVSDIMALPFIVSNAFPKKQTIVKILPPPCPSKGKLATLSGSYINPRPGK